MKDSERFMRMERCKYNRSRSMSCSYTYAYRDTAKNECIRFYGISKRKEQSNDL